MVFHYIVDEFILTLDISTIFNEGHPKVTAFNLAEEAQAEGAKDKKSLKNIALNTNLPLFVGTGLTKGGEKLSQLFGVE